MPDTNVPETVTAALSPPVERRHIHTRRVTCTGYRRTDGLWDIDGHLTDVKTYAFDNRERGEIQPGDPIHEMWVRITVDDRLVVQAIEAATVKGPFSACGAITPRFQCLVGLTIAHGWTRAVRERLGGVKGCTHLTELLGPVATTAFQTIYPILARERGERPDRAHGADGGRPPLLNSCHIFASDGEVVKTHWPAYYTGD